MNMMNNTPLPQDLNASIGSESKDFAVKAEYTEPRKNAFSRMRIGTGVIAFTSIFVFVFLVPIFQGKEVHFESGGKAVVASLNNLAPIVIPAIVIGIFALIGIGILSWGIYSIFKKGGYFVGTPTRLVHYQNGNIRSIDWEQFSGDIEVSGNAQKGDITLRMRTGKIVRSKNSPDRIDPDILYISGIPNVFEVEQICRKRIKENDPTPPNTGNNITPQESIA